MPHNQSLTQRVYDAVPVAPVGTTEIIKCTGLCKNTVINNLYRLKKQKRIFMEKVKGAGGGFGHKRVWGKVVG